jgi:predicted PurR-regulated permease PerM
MSKIIKTSLNIITLLIFLLVVLAIVYFFVNKEYITDVLDKITELVDKIGDIDFSELERKIDEINDKLPDT